MKILLTLLASSALTLATPPPLPPPAPAPPELHGFELSCVPVNPSQLNSNTVVFIQYTTDIGSAKTWTNLTNFPGLWTNVTLFLPDEVAFFQGYESNKLGVSPVFTVESKPLLPGNRTLSIRSKP
jgi:hypothetical protein